MQQPNPIYYPGNTCNTTTVGIELCTHFPQLLSTHNRPIAKTAETPSFLFTGICRLQIEYRGSARIPKSETMFHELEKSELALGLRHFPGTVGFQIFSRGLQANVTQKKMKRYTMRFVQMSKWMAMKMSPLRVGTKIRKYCNSNASFPTNVTAQ